MKSTNLIFILLLLRFRVFLVLQSSVFAFCIYSSCLFGVCHWYPKRQNQKKSKASLSAFPPGPPGPPGPQGPPAGQWHDSCQCHDSCQEKITVISFPICLDFYIFFLRAFTIWFGLVFGCQSFCNGLFFFFWGGIVLECLYMGVRNVSYLCSINGFEIQTGTYGQTRLTGNWGSLNPKYAQHKKYSGWVSRVKLKLGKKKIYIYIYIYMGALTLCSPKTHQVHKIKQK